jgi:hypothetical protein
MLGYVVADGRGAADVLIRDVAVRLHAAGLRLAGAVQVNPENGPLHKCHMDLHILSGTDVVRISQDLGALSQGCRLDVDGLERAVGLVAAAIATGADLLVVNKFGKQEVDGRGFRPVIGEALLQGIPVLVAVNPGALDGFLAYAEDLAELLPSDVDKIADWCLRQKSTDSA